MEFESYPAQVRTGTLQSPYSKTTHKRRLRAIGASTARGVCGGRDGQRRAGRGAGGFAGTLLRPADKAYEGARRVHNGLVDKRPALIAQCLGIADAAACIDIARKHGLDASIRGGGHGVAGTAVTDGGLMIDLSRMKGIHVDPTSRTARAQDGVLWRELNRETQVYGLADWKSVV